MMNQQTAPLKPLISVIVPIYNVEKYVRKCLESLKNQSLKQIEVICIDDGSTDASGRIADEYESDDWPVIKVIHTKNRGLSAARNRGIDEARSEWLMFVDSDDWVDREFCEIPYVAAVENKADMVIFGRYLTNEQGKVKKEKPRKTQTGIIDHETAVDIGDSVAWNKLYKKFLFQDIRYPEGRVYEDVSVVHKLIYKSSMIYWLIESLYCHRVRKGSIEHSTASRIDEYTAKRQQCKELIYLGYPKKKAVSRLQAASLAYCGHAATTDEKLYEEAASVADSIQGVPYHFSKKQRMMLSVWRTNKDLYRMIYSLLGKRMILTERKE